MTSGELSGEESAGLLFIGLGLVDPREFLARVYGAKEEPQPQVVVAFGLRMTNCAPCKSSL